jgi:hypothetical protein
MTAGEPGSRGSQAPDGDTRRNQTRPRAAIAATTDAVIDQARVIARVLLDGFDRHYAVFRDCARAARRHFEAGNWLAIQHVAGDRHTCRLARPTGVDP